MNHNKSDIVIIANLFETCFNKAFSRFKLKIETYSGHNEMIILYDKRKREPVKVHISTKRIFFDYDYFIKCFDKDIKIDFYSFINEFNKHFNKVFNLNEYSIKYFKE